MKYAYCSIYRCPYKEPYCRVKKCEYNVETDNVEEYHNANMWKSQKWINGDDENEVYCEDDSI